MSSEGMVILLLVISFLRLSSVEACFVFHSRILFVSKKAQLINANG